MFREGHNDHRNYSNTPTLVRTLLIRADQLMRVALRKDCPIADAYQALGMAQDSLDEADRLFCGHYYDQIPDGLLPKTFKELTGKKAQVVAIGKAAGSR